VTPLFFHPEASAELEEASLFYESRMWLINGGVRAIGGAANRHCIRSRVIGL